MLNTKPWAKAITSPASEFELTSLVVTKGRVPEGLRGTLYRNGPGRLERRGKPVGHWFDGDGAILAVNFTDGGVSATYKYVHTAGYVAETAAGKFIYSNYGMRAWLKPIKNAANTSVIALPDKLLALWEGGLPHALDKQTLATFGLDNLGTLSPKSVYSAHPKIDYQTGEIFNFGVSLGSQAIVNIYKSDLSGKITQRAQFTLNGIPIIHDFVIAGKYIIFFIPPVRLNLLPVLLGISSYSDAMGWFPHLGTQILVIDRENFKLLSRGATEPWYQWHFANGYVDSAGVVVVDIARYSDFQTNEYLRQVATGTTDTEATHRFTRVQLQPDNAQVISIDDLSSAGCEFPNVLPQYVGSKSPYTYMSSFRPGTDISQEILNTIARFDHNSETFTVADLGENRYPSEPLPVVDIHNSQQTWVLTVVYDGNSHSSEVWIFDAEGLDGEPVCQLRLPMVIPHSFHGCWHPSKSTVS